MEHEKSIEEVDGDLAKAFGWFALSSASLPEAASEAGVTRWELEDAIETAELANVFGLNQDADVSATIDELLGDE